MTDVDPTGDIGHLDGSIHSVTNRDGRQFVQNRIIVLYKNLVRFSNITKSSDLEDQVHSSNKMTPIRPRNMLETWSVYKQLIPVLKPRTLSCMAASEMVASRTLDTKAKMREIQELEENIQNFIANETPFERIKRTYTFDVNVGEPSVQAQRLKTLARLMCSGLFLLGGIKGYIEGKEQFMRNSKFVMFASKGAAHKKRNNYLARCILKQGMIFSFKGGLLGVSIFALHQCIDIYVNRTTPWSLALACGLGASLTKISLGPKGMISTFIIASFLGLCGGLVTWSIANMVGETQDEHNYQAVKARFLAKRMLYCRAENAPVTEYHEEVDDIE